MESWALEEPKGTNLVIANLLPALLAVEHDLFQDEDNEEPEDDDELGHRVVHLRVVGVLDLVEDVVESFVDVCKTCVSLRRFCLNFQQYLASSMSYCYLFAADALWPIFILFIVKLISFQACSNW